MIDQLTNQEKLFLQKLNNEDEQIKIQTLESIKNWLKKEPHLPDDFDDSVLLNFLRGCKFSLEKTKRKLDIYFMAKNAIPEIFNSRHITNPKLKAVGNKTYIAVVPKLTPDGCRITYLESPRDDFTIEETISWAACITMIADYRLHKDYGVYEILILDASIVQWKNLSKVPIIVLKKLFFAILEGYPVRIKAIHVINSNPLVNFVIKWSARFVKEKVMRTIQIHESLESLHEFMPKEFLPEDLGGYGAKVEVLSHQVFENLEKDIEWFEKYGDLKADESKRIENSDNYESLFGVEGSFKQLTID